MNTVRLIVAILSAPLALALILPVVLIGVPFWAVAHLTRRLAHWIEPGFLPWNQLLDFDSVLGWKPKPGLDAHYLVNGDEVFRIKTDSLGWAGETSIAESQVLVVGDSFAFGYGIEPHSSFASIRNGVRIKAVGAPGYSMVQELLLMRQLGQHMRGKLIVWFICIDNDLYDNLNPDRPNYVWAPFVRRVGHEGSIRWEIVTHQLSTSKSFTWVDGANYYRMLAELCTPGYFSERAYSAASFLIEEGQRVCSEAGARLVVMSIPNRNQLGSEGIKFLASQLGPGRKADEIDASFPEEQIGEACRKWNVAFVAGRDFLEFNDYKQWDPHWNITGHRKVARMLNRIYLTHAPRVEPGVPYAEGVPTTSA